MIPPITVLYLGGAGRSGTTLTERMLGEVAGAVAVGETVHLAERGLAANELCGCGEQFCDCPFWTQVGRLAFGGWKEGDAERWTADQHAVDRNRRLPQLLVPIPRSFRRRLTAHRDRLSAMYRAISEVSDCRVVIDSSKHVSTALVLRALPGVNLHVLHLVRDSRGVAYSWTKEVPRPEIAGGGVQMPVFGPASSAGWWLFFNLGFILLRVLGTPTTRLRYEDLVADPQGELENVLARVGLPHADLAFIDAEAASVDLGTSHSVAGNPMRFKTGRIRLRRDDAWRRNLDARSRRTVTALTAPLLGLFGYFQNRDQPVG